ncbi:hypothetical protein SAMN05192558_111129 [Actinokineospora alba]|uniref:Uncharacterized protein n=1 Tax=Actinokineospora alba TaxID=504798 RepID=A0A1H0UEN5_9PSEU|nr:hypothetical protein C8E96_0629 [Actinokineospora alba]SDH55296.1 hypothetical protein SAMN05421871_101452 [Actinokineospora alba]SDP64593.1 hypothetical protein SAMN05192558_111129 [Actinokineospora alba]
MSTCDSAEPSSRNSGFRDGRDPVGRYLAALRPVYLLSRPDRWARAITQDRFHATKFAAPTSPAGERTDPKPGDCRHPTSPPDRHPVTRPLRSFPQHLSYVSGHCFGEVAATFQRGQEAIDPGLYVGCHAARVRPGWVGRIGVHRSLSAGDGGHALHSFRAATRDTGPLRTGLALPRATTRVLWRVTRQCIRPVDHERTPFTGQDQSRHRGAFVGILEERRGVGEWPNAQGMERVPAIPAERTRRWTPILPRWVIPGSTIGGVCARVLSR